MSRYKTKESEQRVLDASKRGNETIKLRALKKRKEYNKNPNRCAFCGKQINYEIRNRNKFCSHSCAAKFNNSKRGISPKRESHNYCLVCGKKCTHSKNNLCRKHYLEGILVERGKLTKGEASRKTKYSAANKYQLIRNNAKDVLKYKKIKKECAVCGYSLHLDNNIIKLPNPG